MNTKAWSEAQPNWKTAAFAKEEERTSLKPA